MFKSPEEQMFMLFGEIAVTVCLHLTATAYF